MEYGDQTVVFDPGSGTPYHDIFITHAHADHSAAFRSPTGKFATEETVSLIGSTDRAILGDCKTVSPGARVRIGDIEVRVHNSGHILGSVEYEVITPEGSLLYTGDLNCMDSYTTRAADTISCDMLVVETTFGSPVFSFPTRDQIALDVVKWAIRQVNENNKIPAFQADSIGNAQELIIIFNRMTRLPVVATPAVAKASAVYRKYGYKLDYLDASSEEGEEILSSGDCVLIAPKASNLSRYQDLEMAFASGWAAILRRGAREPFPLSDHADFRQLLGFVRRCSPKRALTFHGGRYSREFSDIVTRRLGIEASPLTDREETIRGRVSLEASRIDSCGRMLMETARIPGFEYSRKWLTKELGKKGFSKSEVEQTLRRLLDTGRFVVEDADTVRLA